jgi:hypothetical protein
VDTTPILWSLWKLRVPKKEKEEQHKFFFWYKKENKSWISNTLKKVGREDLLEKLIPSKDYEKGLKVKNTFNDAVPRTKSKGKRKGSKKHSKGEFVSVLPKKGRKRSK